MKTYLGLDVFDGLKAHDPASLQIDGLIAGDPFCEFRMFKYGKADMIDLFRRTNGSGKEIIYQTPVYITERNYNNVIKTIACLHDEYKLEKVIVQDVGLADHLTAEYKDLEIIWGRWGRNRNAMINSDFVSFLTGLGINSIESGRTERIKELSNAGLKVYTVYGDISYKTLFRSCYCSYLLDRFSGSCERECLTKKMTLSSGSFNMSVDGYVLGLDKVYLKDSDYLANASKYSDDLMIYAADYDSALGIISDAANQISS